MQNGFFYESDLVKKKYVLVKDLVEEKLNSSQKESLNTENIVFSC